MEANTSFSLITHDADEGPAAVGTKENLPFRSLFRETIRFPMVVLDVQHQPVPYLVDLVVPAPSPQPPGR